MGQPWAANVVLACCLLLSTAPVLFVLLEHTRCHGQPPDTMRLLPEVISTIKGEWNADIVAQKGGCCVSGLFLEGCRWDPNNGCLEPPRTWELAAELPLIWFRPRPEPYTAGASPMCSWPWTLAQEFARSSGPSTCTRRSSIQSAEAANASCTVPLYRTTQRWSHSTGRGRVLFETELPAHGEPPESLALLGAALLLMPPSR